MIGACSNSRGTKAHRHEGTKGPVSATLRASMPSVSFYPQLLKSIRTSRISTTPSPPGCGAMSAGQGAGEGGHAPHALNMARRSSTEAALDLLAM